MRISDWSSDVCSSDLGTSAHCSSDSIGIELAPITDRKSIWRGPMLRPGQVSLGARIDPSRDVPIYMQIIQALIRDIERGRLTSGTYLPSSRQLAKVLGVNRKTVVFAYEDLIAQGWLDSAGTRGTMVAASLPDPVNPHQGEAEADRKR